MKIGVLQLRSANIQAATGRYVKSLTLCAIHCKAFEERVSMNINTGLYDAITHLLACSLQTKEFFQCSAQVTTAQHWFHNPLDHHQVNEVLICRPFHQGKLKMKDVQQLST